MQRAEFQIDNENNTAIVLIDSVKQNEWHFELHGIYLLPSLSLAHPPSIEFVSSFFGFNFLFVQKNLVNNLELPQSHVSACAYGPPSHADPVSSAGNVYFSV